MIRIIKRDRKFNMAMDTIYLCFAFLALEFPKLDAFKFLFLLVGVTWCTSVPTSFLDCANLLYEVYIRNDVRH